MRAEPQIGHAVRGGETASALLADGRSGPGTRSRFDQAAHHERPRGVLQPPQGPGLDLADALARHRNFRPISSACPSFSMPETPGLVSAVVASLVPTAPGSAGSNAPSISVRATGRAPCRAPVAQPPERSHDRGWPRRLSPRLPTRPPRRARAARPPAIRRTSRPQRLTVAVAAGRARYIRGARIRLTARGSGDGSRSRAAQAGAEGHPPQEDASHQPQPRYRWPCRSAP